MTIAVSTSSSVHPHPTPPRAAPINSSSTDYLPLTTSALLHAPRPRSANRITGSLRLSASSSTTTPAPRSRPAAFLFNSCFNANASFFVCVPQPGDALLYNATIHASVHDGAGAPRRITSAQSSMRPTRRGYMDLVAAGWSHSLRRKTVRLPGCTPSVKSYSVRRCARSLITVIRLLTNADPQP